MITTMEGLSYEDRLRCLNLWSLVERRNRQDLIEVFNMPQGKSIIGLQDLFILEQNNKGTRGHSLKLTKVRCNRGCQKHFFSNRVVNGWKLEQAGPANSWSYQPLTNGLD